jgi:O-antigen ligase
MINLSTRLALTLQNTALIFLLLLILSLPSHESPKLIFWGLFTLATIPLLIQTRKPITSSWSMHETLVVIWMFSGFIVAAFAGIQHKEWGGTTDIIIFTSTLLLLSRLSFSKQQTNLIINAILLSTLLASLLAIWQKFVLHNEKYIEFHSVGHVNHTAIYLCLTLVVSVTLLHSYWQSSSNKKRLFLFIIYSALTLTLVLTDSRAAIIAGFLFVSLVALFNRNQKILSALLLSVFLLFTAGNYAVGSGGIINKQIDQVERGIFFEARIKIWRSAILTWQQYPIFGTGIKNYNQVTLDQLLGWCKSRSKNCDADDYMPYAHAHNLYLNTLTERGMFGFLIVLVNILSLSYLVYRYRPHSQSDEQYSMLWQSAVGVLFINVVIGFLNTTLHHENALLSMIILGLFWNKARQVKSS